jgi:plastocyanin
MAVQTVDPPARGHYTPGMRILAVGVLLVASSAAASPLSGRFEPGAQVAVWLTGDAPAAVPREGALDEVWVSFVPKVQVLPRGSTLVLDNRDDESHTVHARLGTETLFNFASVPGKAARKVTLDRPGIVTLTCDLHPQMRAFIVVTDGAYATVTDRHGQFAFADVPDGRYQLHAWRSPSSPHETIPPERSLATVDVRAGLAPLALSLPPARTVEAQAPVPFQPDDARPPPVMNFIAGRWPTGLWVYLFGALGIVGGVLAATANLRLAARRGWSKATALLLGCALAFLAGMLFLAGLNLFVATSLGFGLFIGTVVFSAAAMES